ncbi:uncharacterized protein BT62DRAFT_1010322 [Guyanagaster necrorhizus]|uniref:Fungal-type protein kinase domain-containing protein n=1 Tax=Guyanagaster necrorhizus TaxID=856835 RepID=A0A9P8ANZ6_9AGAR|nr:uncharacterized protein BT62DRAFT_1010322 [Guyanagaster necrorhizus MCA 3950]KAG7442399.1 hypothetical protein BT62DRAFT_1010322 [Guyanagaster necrorhizus MCA 3950]
MLFLRKRNPTSIVFSPSTEMETGGDVPGMVTISRKHVGISGCDIHRPRKLLSHRVLKTIGKDLTMFFNVKDLVICVADAMEAHQAAFDKACILHCDISAGNILITPNKRGFDWDHCSILKARTAKCTGTWRFMSARLMDSVWNPDTLIDEKEFSLWVLLDMALRHTRHPLSPIALHRKMESLFEDGSRLRTGDLVNRSFLRGDHAMPFFAVTGLSQMLRELADVFDVRHQAEPRQAEDELYEVVKASLPNLVESTQKWRYLKKMEKLNSATLLCHTLRAHAEKVKAPDNGSYDWCCNACYSEDKYRESPKKRKAEGTDRLEMKRWKGMGAEMCSRHDDIMVDTKETEEECSLKLEHLRPWGPLRGN